MVRQNNQCIHPSSTYSAFCQIWNHLESKNFGYTLTHTHTKQMLYTNRAEIQSFLLPQALLSININVLCGLNNSQRDNQWPWSVLRLKDPSHPNEKSNIIQPNVVLLPLLHFTTSCPYSSFTNHCCSTLRDKRATNTFSKHGNKSSDIKCCWAQPPTNSMTTAA